MTERKVPTDPFNQVRERILDELKNRYLTVEGPNYTVKMLGVTFGEDGWLSNDSHMGYADVFEVDIKAYYVPNEKGQDYLAWNGDAEIDPATGELIAEFSGGKDGKERVEIPGNFSSLELELIQRP